MSRNLVAITGASSGIGETFARKLAPDYDLLLIARRGDRLSKLTEELSRQHGCGVESIAVDLTVREQLETVAKRLERERRLALLVNNAGFGLRGRFWEGNYEGQEKMHKLHVMATLRLTHAALRNLVAKNEGAIINVSSVSSYIRIAGTTSYAATKSWMTVFSEGIYMDLRSAGSNVIVQALCPGFTYSEFHEAMGVDRSTVSREGYWMTSEYVVEASLEGLRRRKLLVIPNWRYRVLTALVSKLPSSVRLQVEDQIGKRRRRRLQSSSRPKSLQPGG
jgi:short-subunit dehydrogenase